MKICWYWVKGGEWRTENDGRVPCWVELCKFIKNKPVKSFECLKPENKDCPVKRLRNLPCNK